MCALPARDESSAAPDGGLEPPAFVLPVDLLGPPGDDDVVPYELCVDSCDLVELLDVLKERMYLRGPVQRVYGDGIRRG